MMAKECIICLKSDSKKCTGCGDVYYCCREHQKKDWNRHKADCLRPWKVETDESGNRGRYIIATRLIRIGEVLLTEEPTIVGPRTMDPDPVCLACNYPLPFVKTRCRDCFVPLCEEQCQASIQHQMECKYFSKRINKEEDFVDFDIIPAFRFLHWKERNPTTYQQLVSLCSNMQEKQKSHSWPKIQAMAERLYKNYLIEDTFQVSTEEVAAAICTIDSNSFQLLAKSTRQPLTGVYLKSSMFNHNCFPNARPSLNLDHKLKFIATKDIKQGEEVTISYIDSLHSTMQRRAILHATKNFICSCERCKDATEFGTYSSAVRCQTCVKTGFNEGWVISTDPVADSANWKCCTCHLFLDAPTVIQLEKQLLSELFRVNKESLQNIDKFIQAYSSFLHPKHVFLLQLRIWMFQALSKFINSAPSHEIPDLLKKALEIGLENIKDLNKLEPNHSFLIGVTSLEVCEVMIKSMQIVAAKNLGNEFLRELKLRENGKRLAEKSIEILKHEDDRTFEGALYRRALEIEMFFGC